MDEMIAKALTRYDEAFKEWGLPDTASMMACVGVRRGLVYKEGIDPKWVVRGIPLRGGQKCWTIAALQTQEHARVFAAFWGNHVYTEVSVVQLAEGQSYDDAFLSRWEQMFYKPPTPQRPSPRRREQNS